MPFYLTEAMHTTYELHLRTIKSDNYPENKARVNNGRKYYLETLANLENKPLG